MNFHIDIKKDLHYVSTFLMEFVDGLSTSMSGCKLYFSDTSVVMGYDYLIFALFWCRRLEQNMHYLHLFGSVAPLQDLWQVLIPMLFQNTGVVFPNVFFFQYIFDFLSEIMLGMFTMLSNLSPDMLLALQYIVIALLRDWNSIVVVSLILLVLFLFYLGYLGLQFIHLHQLIYMYGMPNLTFINFMMIKYQQTLQLESIYFYIYFLLFIS